MWFRDMRYSRLVKIVHDFLSVCDYKYSSILYHFYRMTRMHSADYAMARWQDVCPSVFLSAHHTQVFCLKGYTYPKVFSPSGSPTILVFLYQTGYQ